MQGPIESSRQLACVVPMMPRFRDERTEAQAKQKTKIRIFLDMLGFKKFLSFTHFLMRNFQEDIPVRGSTLTESAHPGQAP